MEPAMVDAELLTEAADALEALAKGLPPHRLQALSGAFALDSLSFETTTEQGLLSHDLTGAAQVLYSIARGGCWVLGSTDRTRIETLAVAVRKLIGVTGQQLSMPRRIELTLQVANQVQADEVRAAWQEIVSGQKFTHAETLEQGMEAIMERARAARPRHAAGERLP
jgi:hypothetical protein